MDLDETDPDSFEDGSTRLEGLPMTVNEALRGAARSISARDAEVLLGDVLRRERPWLTAHRSEQLAAEHQTFFYDRVRRRASGEPLQYITGQQEFFGLALQVTPAVLIPRPETEHLVEAVIRRLERFEGRPQIIDVGTGSGAIAIALAVALPKADIIAIDISPSALNVARSNAERHGVTSRIRFQQSDLLTELAGESDVIVSNPPYIPFADAASLQREVVDHEPHTALFADDDGLAMYRRLVPDAARLMKSGGLLGMEIGFGQQASVEALLAEWSDVHTLPDYAGTPRVVLATKA